MVTGDNKITAMAIAKECKIISTTNAIEEDSVMEGPEFFKRIGGLWCGNCKKACPCECDKKDVDEEVLNYKTF